MCCRSRAKVCEMRLETTLLGPDQRFGYDGATANSFHPTPPNGAPPSCSPGTPAGVPPATTAHCGAAIKNHQKAGEGEVVRAISGLRASDRVTECGASLDGPDQDALLAVLSSEYSRNQAALTLYGPVRRLIPGFRSVLVLPGPSLFASSSRSSGGQASSTTRATRRSQGRVWRSPSHNRLSPVRNTPVRAKRRRLPFLDQQHDEATASPARCRCIPTGSRKQASEPGISLLFPAEIQSHPIAAVRSCGTDHTCSGRS